MGRRALVFLLVPMVTACLCGSSAGDERSQAAVFSAFETVRPGEVLPVAVRVRVADGWYTYAENPGDAGMPPSIRITGSVPIEMLPWRFPPFKTFTDALGTSYGYEKAVVLLGGLRIPATVPEGTLMELKVEIDWMICRDICVFLQDTFSLSVRTGPGFSGPLTQWATLLEEGGWAAPAQTGEGTEVPGKDRK